jgi:transglutaminase-like putative cysteine protease
MSNSYKAALAIILVITVAGAAFVLLSMRQEEVRQETFEEFDTQYIYVDRQGNAMCESVGILPPSRLADAMKSAAQQLGSSVFEQSYMESTKGRWAQFGLEIENFSFEMTGLNPADNFKIVYRWTVPSIARRQDNHWVISLDWVDNQSAAKDLIASFEYAWIVYRNIAANANFYTYSQIFLVLPEGVENIAATNIGESYWDDYGGGSYVQTSVYTEQIGGRSAIVENYLILLYTKSEITMTPERMLENVVFTKVEYDGAFPTENYSFINSIERLRLDSKYGRELATQYSVFSGQSKYSLTPAQLLYYTADYIVKIDQGAQFSIASPISVSAPSNENGDLSSFWGSLSKSEYVSLAQQVRDNIATTGSAPGLITTTRGNIRFRDALLTFVRILSIYGENGALPNSIVLAPSPYGQISWGSDSIPANYAYFLLPDTYAITNTAQVQGVLDNVYQPSYDNRAYVSALYNWAHNNIAYTLAYATLPLTSEWVLENKQGQCREYTNVCLALLRTTGIPAKRIVGWIVITGAFTPPAGLDPFMKGTTPDGRTIGSHAWNQVYLPGEGWTFADATWGYFENIPYEIYQQQEQTWMGALAGYETAYGQL